MSSDPTYISEKAKKQAKLVKTCGNLLLAGITVGIGFGIHWLSPGAFWVILFIYSFNRWND